LLIFALGESRSFGDSVGRALGVLPSEHEERDFEDGEHKARPLVNVRDQDVFVIHSLYGEPGRSVNDKLCRLLFFLATIQDAGARRVTAVAPYLCYSRKDSRTKTRDPVTTRYVAALFEAVGVDRVVTLDVHNPAAYQNAFRCRTELLEARSILVGRLRDHLKEGPVSVVSPDVGGVKRADRFREALARSVEADVASAFMYKRRSEGVVTGEVLVGRVEEGTAVIIDDLVSTGTTMRRAAQACRDAGAREVIAVATHGLFLEESAGVVEDPAIDRFLVTNTVPPFRLDPDLVRRKVEIVDATPRVAEAIQRMHEGGSVAELNEA